jgi:AraC-like DNA-binding protein
MRHARSADTFRHGRVPTVWARTTAQFVRAAHALGVPRERLLEDAALDAEALEDPDARVPLTSLYALLEGIAARLEDPFVHMAIVRDVPPESLDALAFVVMTSPTYGDGLRAMVRYQEVWSDGERYDLEEGPTHATLVYTPYGPPRLAHAMMAEMFAADMLTHGPLITSEPFEEAHARFTHAAPREIEAHAEHLSGVRAAFGHARNEIAFPSAYLARRVAQEGRESIFAYFERHLETRLPTQHVTSVSARARDVLLRTHVTEHTMAALARALSVSTRTLQRRLADEGTSLRALSEETRRARALALIAGGQSIAEVAYLLGYSEPSAFHRAFRRWTGRTPESFRKSSKPSP